MTYQAKTRSQWMQVVHDNAEALRNLVAEWHPSARRVGSAMVITAPNAELACDSIRRKIRHEEPDDPVAKWDKAIATEDIGAIMSLLSSTWFGVPESTECWSIPGFGVACYLMDDPPEEV
jgi:hypothetical protein